MKEMGMRVYESNNVIVLINAGKLTICGKENSPTEKEKNVANYPDLNPFSFWNILVWNELLHVRIKKVIHGAEC